MLLGESLVHAYICFFLFGLGNGMLGPGISSSLSLSVGKDYQGCGRRFFRNGDTHWAYSFPLNLNASLYLKPFLSLFNGIFSNAHGTCLYFSSKRHKWIRDKNYREDRNIEAFEGSD